MLRADALLSRFGTAACLAALVVIGVTTDGRAQGSDRDPALAETLFQSGRDLMNAGRFVDACPKLAESHRLDPAGGTVLMLGSCHEAAKKWASAWVAFNEAIGLARKDGREDREKRAKERLALVEGKMTRLSLKVSPAARAVKGLTIRRDGREVPEAAWDTPFPLDPGDHVIEASAPGHKAWSTPLPVPETRADTALEVPVLTPLPRDVPATTASAAATAVPPPATSAPAGPKYRTAAISVGVVGAVALGVGTYFGARAISLSGKANDRCPQPACGDRAAVDDSESAAKAARIANVGVALGVLALGGATALWFGGNSAGAAPAPTRTVKLSPSFALPVAGTTPQASLSMEGQW